MRRLAQPQVVVYAAVAAAISALLSAPRMLLWSTRPFFLWYVEAVLFLGSFVLWAFVFAWHREYTHRPVFTFKIKRSIFAGGTVEGLVAAVILRSFLDPVFRPLSPQDYPSDLQHWLAGTVFALAFTQLFLIYAPFAWLIRLFRRESTALWLTVAFNVFVLALKTHSSPVAPPAIALIELLAFRIAISFFAVWFYLRGGILLTSWLGLLIEARHLLDFH